MEVLAFINFTIAGIMVAIGLNCFRCRNMNGKRFCSEEE